MVAVALVVAGSAACTFRPRTGPPNLGPGTATEARKYLEGTWSLLSFTAYLPEGGRVDAKATGTLTYDDFGNLFMEFTTDDATAAALAKDGIPFQNGRFSAKGRTAVDMQNKTLTFVLQGSPAWSVPPAGPLSASHKRHWQVDGNRLTLTTKDAAGKDETVATWQKK